LPDNDDYNDNDKAQQELEELAQTQAALRRLATLVARGEPSEVVFAAATREALRHFGSGTARMIRFELDGTATLVANEGRTVPEVRVGERWVGYPPTGLTATVLRTGKAARVDDYHDVAGGEATVREGIRSAVAVPIHVNGRLWGMIAVGPGQGPLPPDTEQRMAEFTELVATAVANAQTRAELVTSRARIVAASDEARRRIERDLHDGAQQRLIALALRLRWAAAMPHESDEIRTEITDVVAGLMDVIDELREISHGIHPAILSKAGLPSALRAIGRRSAVPVDMDLRIDGRLPEPIEVGAYYVVSEMLTNATKHARASVVEVHAEVSGGTLRVCVRDDGVGGADPLRGSGLVGLQDRIEALGGTFSLHSPTGGGTTMCCELPVQVGAEHPDAVPARQKAGTAGRPEDADLDMRPGETSAGEIGELERAFNPMYRSPDTGRDELTRLLQEQAALRRVATLVASGIHPVEIFSAVAEEIRRLLGADNAGVGRLEQDGTSLVVLSCVGENQVRLPIGTHLELLEYPAAAKVLRTGQAARVDEDQWATLSDPVADGLRQFGIRSMVASPIMVEGRLWGVVNALTRRGPFPSGTADRLAHFTELVATAVGNAESRAELTASRARIVAASDEARRRIERDLHDGTQQRLVSLGLGLRLAQSMVPAELPELATELDRVADELNGVVEDLREIARGIHPVILSQGGLGPALRTLARRAAIAVELDVAAIARLPEPIEVAAYYVVSEMLTNATKHARASVMRVSVEEQDDTLHISIRHDGVAGVDPARGSRLIDLRDRAEALGGSIDVSNRSGEGTLLLVQLPLRLP
jgi:signal transduction histidine kinase